MQQFLIFIFHPHSCQNKKPEIRHFFGLLLLYVFSTFLLSLLIIIICKAFNLTHKEIDLPLLSRFIVVAILAPVYEEIIFRGWLKFTKTNVLLFIVTLLGVIITCLFKHRFVHVFFLSTFLLIFTILQAILKRDQIERFISSRLKYFFYISTLLFGFGHAFNFTGNIYAIIAFSFILGSPQIVMGAILGYIRMTYGLAFSILFHMSVNSIIVFSIIKDVLYVR